MSKGIAVVCKIEEHEQRDVVEAQEQQRHGEDPGCKACHPAMTDDERARARAAKRVRDAGPKLLDALLAVEFACIPGEHYDPPADADVCSRERHARTCLTDAALTAAGLDTAEKRDAARAELAKR